LLPALSLGRRAAALGLSVLELARIHEEALAPTLVTSKSKKTLRKRAELFFNEALIPIVETHRGAKQSRTDLHRLRGKLDRQTLELAASKRQVQQGTVRRQNVEAALKQSGDHYTRLLQDSLELQKGLRQLTHKVLSAQEDERWKISSELRNEVGQTLLGINVRLLTLKMAARGSSANLTKDVACTRRLVKESVQSINRFARQLGKRRHA
jgi:signal transduction histidine kinase